MKYHKIILAGGNGYLGRVLAAHYSPLADEVILLSRKQAPDAGNVKIVVWDAKQEGAWTDQLERADLLINLCGKNVNCRYTKKNKTAIIRSRVVPTALLSNVLSKLQHPPKLWINVTSATIYRHAEDRPQDELTGEIGNGFSVDVCQQWEQVFFKANTPGVRKIALRMGIVFGKSDGVFPRLLNLVKFGLGGRQGNGQQYVSWIHEQDVCLITEFLVQHHELSGILNCTAPNAEKNAEQMRLIRRAYGRRFGLPATKLLLQIGALVIGTETELILKSRWVMPRLLLDAGYTFKYPFLQQAVQACVK
ncbi:MAG: TIGR01777 family protein [Hymenobacter sp.]|nr:MAG: TIGR01777 family protein [Hymenobacter sp.]